MKKLMLLTALCAIISCGGGGGTSATNGGTSASNGPTPSTPINQNIIMKQAESRYTKTKLENMTDINYLKNFEFKEAVNKDEIRSEEYGYKLTMENTGYNRFFPSNLTTIDSTGITYSSNPTSSASKIIVGNEGIGISVNDQMEYGSVPYQEIKDKLNFAINKIITQFARSLPGLAEIEVKEGGTLITFEGYKTARYIYLDGLEEYEFGHYNGTPYGVSLNVTGNGDIFKFRNYQVMIDENINLDDPSNKYTKILTKMINPRTYVKKGVKITGSKDNQIGIREIGEGFGSRNEGAIELKGNNTIGVYIKNSEFSNYGTISVNKNSTGIYILYDNDYDEYSNIISNYRDIVIGENSTGIYVHTKYDDNLNSLSVYSGLVENANKYYGIRADENAANAVGMLLDTGEEKSTSSDPDSSPTYTISNNGIIELKGDRSTGMYLTGKAKAEAINADGGRPLGVSSGGGGRIIIGDSKDINRPGIGMYSDNPNGSIRNTTDFTIIEVGKNAIGMAGVNKTEVENTSGTIIIKGDNSIGMYLSDGARGLNWGTIKTEGAPKNAIGVFVGKDAEFINDRGGEIIINSEGGAGIVVAGGTVLNYGTIKVSGGAVKVKDITPVLAVSLLDRVMPAKKDIKVYVDSLGKTNPIEGLANLGFKNAELSVGAEATEKTNATEVTVAGNVLAPFNKSIKESNIGNWSVGSGSLVWEAEPEIRDNNIEKVTLKKQSYAKYADEKTEEVAKALDEKYVNTMAESKDKQIFNDMNKLKTEKELAKTYKEVSGGQYINVQQRINQTDEVLERELTSLKNNSIEEAGHHISTFAGKDNYEAKTPEIAKSKSINYGAAYLYNDTNNGWGAYAGAVMNKFKLEDEGKSKENMTLVKAGAYKTFDIGPVDWTIGGEGNISWNEMKRRYVSLGTVYENKADYNSYGLAVKNELSKTYQLNDVFTFKPYGALKIGFGKFTDIKEKNSTLGLEVKGNSYYSVKPALGMELGLGVPVGTTAKFKASLGLAYEHELGKIENNENEAKFISAGSSWKLKGAKDEDRGGLKSELKAGFEAGNYNIYLTGGYNTKGKNSHVGIKFGVSF